MHIEERKNGHYRIRQMYNGKNYSITLDHKPTKKEAIQLLSDILDNDVKYSNMTFKRASEEYLKIKSNVLSPTTIRGYNALTRVISNRFNSLSINLITQSDVQKEINDYAKGHSAKSVKNLHGFISAVLKEFRPNLSLYTKLPQNKVSETHVPDADDIEKVLAIAKGGRHELGFKLALCGLRRSEICALTPEDLDGNDILHINKAWVLTYDNVWVCKELNKTDAGTRDILLPKEFAELYRNAKPDKNNHVYRYKPDTLRDNLTICQNKVGVEHFTLHAMRHYYCSLLHSQGVSDAVIQKLGGWKSDYTMKRIYRHALDDDKNDAMKKLSDVIGNL